jgi:hypothetical protein
MLHELLAQYLTAVENALMALDDVYVERYEEEILTPERANLRIRLRFSAGHMLEINEAVTVEGSVLEHLDYRYHSTIKFLARAKIHLGMNLNLNVFSLLQDAHFR